jgi:segregation and condensation protein B
MNVPALAVLTAASDAAVVAHRVASRNDRNNPQIDAEATSQLIETIDRDAIKAQLSEQLSELGGDDDLPPSVIDLPPQEIRAIVEAVLLVATKPIKADYIARALPGTDERYIEGLLAGLESRFAYENRGFRIEHLAGGWRLATRPAVHSWVRKLDKREPPAALSRSALETLAIVAYKQPITRGAIEDIRGVQCGPMLRQLIDLHLVQLAGRAEGTLGRPWLYATTDHFLERFGLASTDDLPKGYEFGAS